MMALIVHGGAGRFPPGRHAAARDGCRRAWEAGWAMLQQCARAVDVVERAVALLEDDPTFNAGTGSHANAEGFVEMDAILVDGATLNFGAVGALRHVRNPVRVARRVLESTEHCFLVGQGATRFAHDQGFETVDDAELAVPASTGPDSDTVGAVALDAFGHVATATSTGGTKKKLSGRVGDSPLIGCGAIADDGVGGASATGHGEDLMKLMMARTVLDHLKAGKSAHEAANAAVSDLESRIAGRGGVICIDAHGNVGHAHNTEHLAVAWSTPQGEMAVSLSSAP